MSRVTIIVSLWLLLVGSISDSAASGTSHRRPLELLGLYVFVTAAAALALWLHLGGDAKATGDEVQRDPWHYD